MRFALACFDLDGTLVDSHADIGAALEAALAAVPGDPARDALALAENGHGHPLEHFFAVARPERAGDQAAQAAFVEAYVAYYQAHLVDRTVPFPGVVETLERIAPLRARGLRCAVATTKRTATARRVIDALRLAPYFDAVCGTDGMPHKPAPDVLHFAARAVDRSGAPAIMVGDTDRDVRAGRAAGMQTCGVGWGVQGAIGLRPHAPDYVIESFPELWPILAG